MAQPQVYPIELLCAGFQFDCQQIYFLSLKQSLVQIADISFQNCKGKILLVSLEQALYEFQCLAIILTEDADLHFVKLFFNRLLDLTEELLHHIVLVVGGK